MNYHHAQILAYYFVSNSIHYNSSVAAAVLWITLLEAVFAASTPVFVAVSSIFPRYLVDKFIYLVSYLVIFLFFS